MRRFRLLFIATALLLSACAQTGSDIYDPFEPLNRQVHAFNKSLDRQVVSPVGRAYGQIFSEKDQEIIDNVSNNFSQPSIIINRLLQFKIGDAISASFRFVINTTLGFGGMGDVATQLGFPTQSTDFGATLGAWDVPAGPYLELPVWGSSTTRDIVGSAVNFIYDPFNLLIPARAVPLKYGINGLETIGDRNQFADLVDNLLYETEDSYAAVRLYYLQNRHFEITGEVVSDITLEDQIDDQEDFSDFDEFYE